MLKKLCAGHELEVAYRTALIVDVVNGTEMMEQLVAGNERVSAN